MADPICRWRNPRINTVLELIAILPKEELAQDDARQIVNNQYPDNFYRTPYQLACQLGLYHETEGRYFPKFTRVPTEQEVIQYLRNWIIHYSVPNPYTRGFIDLEPFSIHAEICKMLLVERGPLQWVIVRDELFKEQIGNNDILINSLNSYSPVIEVNDGEIGLKGNVVFEELEQYIDVDISANRNNREYFFDLFLAPSSTEQIELVQNIDLITDIPRQDIDAINEVQNLQNISQTEKNRIVAARIGQGYFRRQLLSNCGLCPITGVDDSRLLIASHIKPWRLSDNQERIDSGNGLMFTPTYDKLFDAGFISFTNEKRIIISPFITEENMARFNLENNRVYPLLQLRGKENFLDFHRNNILKVR